MRKVNLVLFLVGALLSISLWAWVVPSYSEATIRFASSEERSVPLPIHVSMAAEPFVVEFSLERSQVSPTTYLFLPDDCIDGIVVNGVAAKQEKFPYCDFENPIQINFGDLLRPGTNTIVLHMRNLGWAAGVAVWSSWSDASILVCSFFTTVLAALFLEQMKAGFGYKKN